MCFCFAHKQELECKSFPPPACSALSPWWPSKSRNLCLFYYQLKAARDKFSEPFIHFPTEVFPSLLFEVSQAPKLWQILASGTLSQQNMRMYKQVFAFLQSWSHIRWVFTDSEALYFIKGVSLCITLLLSGLQMYMHAPKIHLLHVQMGMLHTDLFRDMSWQVLLRGCLGIPSLLTFLTTLCFPEENNDNVALRVIVAAHVSLFSFQSVTP